MTTENMTEEKVKKQKKTCRLKTSASLYIWLTIIAIVLIGAGCGISIFELSEYKTANYRALPLDPALPQLELQTTTLEATYEKDAQFKLDTSQWNITDYNIQYDNTLKDKVIIEVTAPKELYNVYLTTYTENHYYLHCEEDIFGAFRYTLDLAKDNFVPEYLPPVTITLTMNEAQAKNFKLNEEYYKSQEAANDYREELNIARTEYNEQLNQLHTEYTEQLNSQRTEYTEQLSLIQEEHTAQINSLQQEHTQQIEDLRQQYDGQLEENRIHYENRIAELEQQLDNVRNSLN